MEKKNLIDPNYDSYQSFFDHAWAQGLDQLAAGTPFAEVVFNLCAAWKAVANTHRLPWLDIPDRRNKNGFASDQIFHQIATTPRFILQRMTAELAGKF